MAPGADSAGNEEGPSSIPQPQSSADGAPQEPAEQYDQSFHPPPLSHYYPTPFYAQPQLRPHTNEGRPSTPLPMTYLPPPPPPLGNGYASPGYWLSQTGQHQSPFCSNQQMPNLGGMEGSPYRFQHERGSSISQQMPGTGASFVPPFQLGGGAAYPYPFATQGGLGSSLGASMDGQGLPYYRPIPTHLGMQGPHHPGNKEGGLLSPSGVTASSMQVNAPTSPPSAPSVSMQPTTPGAGSSENQHTSNGGPTSPTTTNNNNNNTPSVPLSQPAGGGTLAAASGEEDPVAAGGAAAAAVATMKGSGLKEAARKGGVAVGENLEGDEDSMSSLPILL